MPDTLSLTAGVSFGLLAGIVSGVCYLVANGFMWPRSDREHQRRCISGADDGVCQCCGGDKHGSIVPCICQPHTPQKFESGAWFLRQVQRAVSLMPWTLSTEKLEQIDEECEGRDSPGEGQELRNVREFLETLSAKLAGGQLEGTSVAPLYNHPAYVRMLERYHAPLRNTLASLATALRDALTRKLACITYSMHCVTIILFGMHYNPVGSCIAAQRGN
ncbi:uncharacterized protein LOC131851830 [Achroia grisella]|uniref:uncharacterized protein LOC131851830 n=1 Tax=Achroia grisella TaxID=688607 RepID=UPI0027D217FC|nr:uncharacterized protein LOC131851830 [Achroia grisella]